MTVGIQFDYTLDTNGFFTAERKSLLEQAAHVFTDRFQDTLAAIPAAAGSDTWTAKFFNPATGAQDTKLNMVVPANTLIVFAGGRDFPDATLGQGGPGGVNVSGTSNWVDLILARGETGANAATPNDFGPWGGAITFDTSANWHFGATTTGLTASQSDFVTVATHELGHLFGFGSSPSWDALASSGSFTGTASKAEYDLGGNIPLAADESHWVDGTTDGGLETIMDPSITMGTRKVMTQLDFAAFDDIGWELSANSAPVLNNLGSPQFGSVPEDATTGAGTTISAMIATGAGGDPISDPDAIALEGIAVIAADTAHGTWEYSINGGTNWLSLGTPTAGASRLLAADANTRLRLLPSSNFSGTITSAITFRAWDRTSGTNGSTVNTSTSGGSTAFSSATETASIVVSTIVEGVPNLPITNILEDTMSGGIVITPNAADGSEVTHFKIHSILFGSLFLNDGVTPVTAGSFVTSAQAGAGLRFKPSDDFFGAAGFLVQAATGSNDAALGGSAGSATVNIASVNDTPTFLASPLALSSFAGTITLSAWATQVDIGPSNESLQTFHFVVEQKSASEANLFDNAPAIANDGTLSYKPTAGKRGTATFEARLVDNGGGSDTSAAATFTVTFNTIPFQNTHDPLDVDDNDFVEPLDALIVINNLNDVGPHPALNQLPASGEFFWDVTGDTVVDPLDALTVINFLNENVFAGLPISLPAFTAASNPQQAAVVSTAAEEAGSTALPASGILLLPEQNQTREAGLPRAGALDAALVDVALAGKQGIAHLDVSRQSARRLSSSRALRSAPLAEILDSAEAFERLDLL